MEKKVELKQLIPIIIEKVNCGGSVTITPTGNSMNPMLYHNTCTVTLVAPKGPLKKYELPLYARKDNSYVLHRVLKVNKNGTYSMCGDNQFVLEHGITHKAIVAVVSEFSRKGKSYSVNCFAYKAYYHFWVAIRPIRHFIYAVKFKINQYKKR